MRRLIALISTGMPCSGGYAASEYVMTNLGVLGDDTFSVGLGICDAGYVAGGSAPVWSRDGQRFAEAFLYRDGHMHGLGFLADGMESWGYDVNNYGDVVGWSDSGKGYGYPHAYCYSAGMMTLLPEEGTFSTSFAYAISNNDKIVGWIDNNEQTHQHASYWYGNQVLDMNRSAWASSEALDVNDGGMVVGKAWTGQGGRGMLWYDIDVNQGTFSSRPLHPPTGRNRSETVAVNDAGDMIVGESNVVTETDATYHATRWYETEPGGAWEAVELPSAYKGSWSTAEDVNDDQLIVGSSLYPGGDWDDYSDRRATLWDHDAAFDLNDLLHEPDSDWVINAAFGINDDGLIVGLARNIETGVQRAVLLTPIPEPASLSLLVFGALMLRARRR